VKDSSAMASAQQQTSQLADKIGPNYSNLQNRIATDTQFADDDVSFQHQLNKDLLGGRGQLESKNM